MTVITLDTSADLSQVAEKIKQFAEAAVRRAVQQEAERLRDEALKSLAITSAAYHLSEGRDRP